MNEDLYLDAAFEDQFYYAHDELERDQDEPYEPEHEEPDCDDGDDGAALASAGWGTDEDYGGWGEEY